MPISEPDAVGLKNADCHSPEVEGEAVSDFDTMVRHVLRTAGDVDFEIEQMIREEVRLQYEYPNQYVAYVDCWKTAGEVCRLERRTVAHDRSLLPVQRAISALCPAERNQVSIDYFAAPWEELEVHYDLPCR